MWIVLYILFCAHLRPSADALVNDLGLLYNHYLSIRKGLLLAFAQGAQGPVAQATPSPLNG